MLPTVKPDVPRDTTTHEDPTLPPVPLTYVPPPAAWHRWNWLLFPLGVAVALASGIAVAYLLPTWDGQALLAHLWEMALVLIVGGTLAAGLLGSWWAVLLVPVVVSAGSTMVMERPGLNLGALLWVVLLAAIGAVVGAFVSGWIERRLHL